jgi:restriction system protein
LGFGLMLEAAVWIFENFLNDSGVGTKTEIYVPWLHYSIGIVFLLLVLRVWYVLGTRRKTSSISSSKAKRVQEKTQPYTSQSLRVRPDDDLLRSSFQALNGAEFERLLALYFRDQGFTVQEVGVGGNDGGVDLVIVDSRGEKTAVQAKCYAERNLVPVQTVRELVAAKRNHNCILSLIITTSDLTAPAKKEAEQFKVDYWHGALLDHKLRSWGKWQPTVANQYERPVVKQAGAVVISTMKEQVAASSGAMICECGASLVKRVSRTGNAFWGCSTFPKCRHTQSVK